jgi:ATP-binding protein involved in chromosome partitioning
MPDLSQDRILTELKRIAAPDGRGNIVSSGLVSDIVINGGEVTFALTTSPQHRKSMEQLQAVVQRAVAAIPGVTRALVVLTAERQTGQKQQSPPQRGGAIPGIKHIIAVASGKGGVGKSTTAIDGGC